MCLSPLSGLCSTQHQFNSIFQCYFSQGVFTYQEFPLLKLAVMAYAFDPSGGRTSLSSRPARLYTQIQSQNQKTNKNMQTNKKNPNKTKTKRSVVKSCAKDFENSGAAQRLRLWLQLTFTAWLFVLIGGFFRAACSAAVMFPVMTVKGITAKGSPALQDDFLNSNKNYCGHYVYYWKLHQFISNMSIRS